MPFNPFKKLITIIKEKRQEKKDEAGLVYYCEYCKMYFDYTNGNDTHKRYAKAHKSINKH